MGLFDIFKKKNNTVAESVKEEPKEPVFEDLFMDIQKDMVSICLEYCYEKADVIYILGACEKNMLSSYWFYDFGGKIVERHELNKVSPEYDGSPQRQKQCMQILVEDVEKLFVLCKEHQRPMPTELRLIYNVKTHKFESKYNYEPVWSNHPTKLSNHIVDEWIQELKTERGQEE